MSAAETCPNCGGDASENWFDRSICACGLMHTCCNNCGFPLDGCDDEDGDFQTAAEAWLTEQMTIESMRQRNAYTRIAQEYARRLAAEALPRKETP